MVSGSAVAIIKESFDAISNDVSSENSKLTHIVKKVASHPFKILATFFAAPILIIKVALSVKNPTRRFIAVIGLILAILLAYGAGTVIGSLSGAWLIATQVGVFMAAGFLIGSMLSVFLSLVFCIFVFNSVSFVFLKMSSQEVVDYLDSISK